MPSIISFAYLLKNGLPIAKAILDTQRVHFKTCLNAKMLAWLLTNISTGKLSCLTKQNNTGKLENNLSPSN